MDVSPLRSPVTLLRALMVLGAAGLAEAGTAAAQPVDGVVLSSPGQKIAYQIKDGDGNLIVRPGDPTRLGRLVDHCQVGDGPNDCRLIQHKPGPQGEQGYAVMAGKDLKTDHLTVPLAPISGIEAPILSQDGVENYFADAWKDGRRKAAEASGSHPELLPRNAIALAVNSQNCRSQDRLHIHADRLDPKWGGLVHDELAQGHLSQGQWTLLKPVDGHQYRATWVAGQELQANPFQLVHDQLVAEHGGGQQGQAYAGTHMGQHSIAVIGETDAQGRPGFVIVDGRFGSDPKLPQGPHHSGSAEEWLLGHGDSPR